MPFDLNSTTRHPPASPDYCVSDEVNAHVNAGLARRRAAKLANENRNYLGMSELGERCNRKIFYSATGAPRPPLTGENLRRFEMGHYFELMALEWLLEAGFQIKSRNSRGEQFEFITAGGRIKGHIDGVIIGGPRDIPRLVYPALSEIKAIDAKSWNQIVKHGLEKAEPRYFGQTNQYMGYSEVHNTLFSAINKNTAEIFHAVIPFNLDNAQRCSDRGVNVLKAIDMRTPPPRISARPEFYVCKMCQFNEFCWSSAT